MGRTGALAVTLFLVGAAGAADHLEEAQKVALKVLRSGPSLSSEGRHPGGAP